MIIKKDRILAILKNFKENHAKEYGIVEIGIFGSIARNEEKEDSDIDIVFKTDIPNLFRTARMKVELEKIFEKPIDIVRLRDNMNSQLKQNIIREACYV